MEFMKIEVQALDSLLGRWEPAKVLEVFDDGSVKVSFIGWGKEYDTVVKKGEVRAAVDPFLHEIGTVQSRSRKCTKNERNYLSYLRTLVAGDEVRMCLENGEVALCQIAIVDRFKRTLTVDVDGTRRELHASCLDVPKVEHETLPPKRRRKSGSDKKAIVDGNENCLPSVPTSSISSGSTSHSSPVESYFKDGYDFAYGLNGAGEKVGAGDVRKIVVGDKDVDVGVLRVACKDLANVHLQVEGFVLGDEEVHLKVPIGRVRRSETTVTDARERAKLNQAMEKARELSLNHSRSSHGFRTQVRRHQLGKFLRDEINAALNRKSSRSVINLGVACLDTDLCILGIDPHHRQGKEYSYKKNNLSTLDNLLGSRWDVKVVDSRVSFVSSITFKVSAKDILTASVATSFSWNSVDEEDYRGILKEACCQS